jgi:hypothetical protein
MNRYSSPKLAAFAVAFLLLAVGACDNPVDRGGDHPSGIRVMSEANVQVARFRVGGTVIGELTAAMGTPATFTLVAIDRNENVMPIDGTDIWVTVAVTGGVATAEIEQTNRLIVTPVQAGTGRIDLTVMHGGHAEFTARLPLTVTQLSIPD